MSPSACKTRSEEEDEKHLKKIFSLAQGKQRAGCYSDHRRGTIQTKRSLSKHNPRALHHRKGLLTRHSPVREKGGEEEEKRVRQGEKCESSQMK